MILPENDPDQLPPAFFVKQMKELYTKIEKAQEKMELLCEMCSRLIEGRSVLPPLHRVYLQRLREVTRCFEGICWL